MKTKLIRRQENVALVEVYDDGKYSRVIVPSNLVSQSGVVSADVVEMGIPYGCPWEEMITLTATPEMIANELRKRGVYTVEDLMKSPNAAFSAIQYIYSLDAQSLLKTAREIIGGKR